MTLSEASEILEMFLHKQCDLKSTEFAYSQSEVWKAVEMATEALEKQTPKKPDFEGDGYDENGCLIYDTWICPCCEVRYEIYYEEYEHCPNCGQTIDWSDTE